MIGAGLAAALAIATPLAAQTAPAATAGPVPDAAASLRLDPVFGAAMVLQRDRPVALSGTASAGAAVTVAFAGTTMTATADVAGHWAVTLPAHQAGGPWPLTVTSTGETVRLDDVLVGDVWLCSGQSNMEFPLRHATSADALLAAADQPQLRLLKVPHLSAAEPQRQPGGPLVWQRSSAASASDFSAVCHCMGSALLAHQHIPIGLIDASWGGSAIEEWLDAPTISQLPAYVDQVAALARYARDPVAGQAQWAASLDQWLGSRRDAPAGTVWRPVTDYAAWESWGGRASWFDGIGWYRAHLVLRPEQVGAAELAMGAADDIDLTRINGVVIGADQAPVRPRQYRVPAGVLHAGDNVLDVTVIDLGGQGGLIGRAPVLRLANGSEVPFTDGAAALGDNSALLGRVPVLPWQAPSGVTTLFNGMIAPLGAFPMAGIAWYQGESNVNDPIGYASLMALLNRQWRSRFGAKGLVMVQLAAFGARSDHPEESNWGRFRDVQRRLAALDPTLGLASALDLGDPDDIHPTQKRVVGERIALEARHIVLGEPIVSRGPEPVNVQRLGGMIRITMANGPLRSIGGDGVLGLELCATPSQFDAHCRFVAGYVDGSALVLPDDPDAHEVRYLWQASPLVNLYNAAGLPASPFRIHVNNVTRPGGN